MTQLEKDIEKKLRQKVEALGGKCPKWVSPGWGGVPDRLILLPGGRIIFCETKRPKGSRVAALQKKWREWLTKLGFYVATTYTVEEVERLEIMMRTLVHASRQCTDCFFSETPDDEFPCKECERRRLWCPK